MADLLGKHETSADNFDRTLESHIRSIDPLLHVERNRLISSSTRFNNDLFIYTGAECVAIEIEKGTMSRFEFDILKMQVFASLEKKRRPDVQASAAFLVPMDNIVARHIAGNARESSYGYLGRLFRLLCQLPMPDLDDILVVGYEASDSPPATKRAKTVQGEKPIMETPMLEVLKRFPAEPLATIRKNLAAAFPKLREKLNPKMRYLGYANGEKSDAAYIYLQRERLVMDIRISADLADEVKQRGFQIRPRNNYQGRAGWLTGVIVPHDVKFAQSAVELLMEALKEDGET